MFLVMTSHLLRWRRCGVVRQGGAIWTSQELLRNLKTPFKVSISKHNHPMCSPIFWTSSLIITHHHQQFSHISHATIIKTIYWLQAFGHCHNLCLRFTQPNDSTTTAQPNDRAVTPLQWCTLKWSTARPVATPSTSGPTKQTAKFIDDIAWSLGEKTCKSWLLSKKPSKKWFIYVSKKVG